MTLDIKSTIVNSLQSALADELSAEQIMNLLEVPKTSKLGDYAFPTFILAKSRHQAPQKIAAELVEQIDKAPYEQIVATGAYVNFFLDKGEFAEATLQEVISAGDHYGDDNIGQQGNVPIDMSSPNIAKPMSMGHLRSTVIGNSLANILAKIGYKPIKINYLGDWGTQFGKLIVGYHKWGSEEEIKADPIGNLLKYYVQFHEAAEEDPELNDEGRAWFKKLEDGDPEATHLWEWFRGLSLAEFQKIYDRLGITFDSYNGEAYYNDKMDPVVDELTEKGLLEMSQGAQIVDLTVENLTPALIKRTDGATLYITRDLAAAIDRYNQFHFVKSLYVVGSEQTEHFKQLKAVLKKMGDDWADEIVHVPFGLITKDGKKLSTRKGNVVLLDKVLDEAVGLAKEQISAKNPDLANADQVADQVGVGAVVFHDLKNDRMDSFDFSLGEVVRFEGETGPYVQYSNARAQSILRKAQRGVDLNGQLTLADPAAWDTLKTLADFPATILRAAREYEPSVIAKYALRLAKTFNKYYANSKILVEDDELNARLALVQATSQVLTQALSLLGVQAPTEM
ncbi:arginyl-tRNA synthetase [Lapidilactobacillus dextrinicus DSM 20335]|uniref:Arginine--tRNA ligase n=1 Tax=Lapidilactobacillus dextrinicus DSM 20335 TaxID=1423738 RepID=A0A0R2BGG7_9LACO|nr:arginyl-tRNA synthetase [Lapidilactobacillus dextrinicus DSM 20335]QFG47187.1 arginine--tRNA ligase [Lapidilactobacillus dextrinicus]